MSIAQNIGIGTINPHASSALDITDTARGILIPRMTMAQRLNIAQPAEGLMVYQTDSTKGFWHWDGAQWKTISQTNTNTNAFSPQRITYAQRNALVNPLPGTLIYCTDCGTRGQAQIFNGLGWTDLTGGVAWGNVSVDTINNTVTIGTQTWSTKNLDVARYRNGDPIPQVTDPTQWSSLTTGAWCWYNNDSATYGAKYGRLYNWYAVNDSRGLAPQGWHVPNVVEWDSLFNFFGGVQVAGAQLKSINGWLAPNNGASNSSGFTGLPGGFRYENGSFLDVGNSGHWWCFDEIDTYSARNRFLYNFSVGVFNNNYYPKTYGFSVRVLRD